MKHLKKFNPINENHTHENDVDIIIDTMQDFLDDDRNILFKSPIDDMRYQDYIAKNSNYLGFKPILNTGSRIRSQFSIVFQDIKDYSDFLSVSNQMQSVFGRLKDEDWTMYDMKIGTTLAPLYQGDVKFTFLSFYFSKPDQKLEEEFKWPDEEDLKKAFDKYGLSNLTFDYFPSKGPVEVTIEFDSNSYNGRVSNSVEELFELICNRFGFDSYDYTSGNYKVTFYV
jgi:hypothetical protein